MFHFLCWDRAGYAIYVSCNLPLPTLFTCPAYDVVLSFHNFCDFAPLLAFIRSEYLFEDVILFG